MKLANQTKGTRRSVRRMAASIVLVLALGGIMEQELHAQADRPRKMHVCLEAGTPRQIEGGCLQRPVVDEATGHPCKVRTARTFLRANRGVLGIENPDGELVLKRQDRGSLGREQLRFSQRFQAIPIWPSDLVVHLDTDGNVDLMNGAFVRTPSDLSTEPTLSAEAALQLAGSSVPGRAVDAMESPTLIIYAPGGDVEPRLAWKAEFHQSLVSHWLVVVDARTGEELTAFDTVCRGHVAGSGVDVWGDTQTLNVWDDEGVFHMINTTKSMFDPTSTPPSLEGTRGGIVVLDARNAEPDSEGGVDLFHVQSGDANSWDVPDAVSAAYCLSETYDYYMDRHARNSLDGNGGTMIAAVRWGQNFANAFWNGEMMIFGDGQRYAGSLDTVGHELTHGVTDHASKLVYQDQSGALNEALSDIFGEAVEARTLGRADWLKGDELSGDPIQNYADPRSAEQMEGVPNPSKMSEFVQMTEDNGGVHINSSIINHCFFLLAEGMNGSIGITDAEKIFYRANTVHLVQNSQFIDCRLACVRSAEELFGANSTQAQATAAAFDAVEIFDGGTVPVPDPTPQPEPTPNPTPAPAPNGDDSFEDNDTADSAASIGPGSYQLQGLDEDWFMIEANGAANVTITIDGPDGDLDLYVFDSFGYEVASSLDEGSREAVEISMFDEVAYIAVAPYEGQTSSYTLTVNAGSQSPMPQPTPGPNPLPFPGSDDIDEMIDACGVASPLPMMAVGFCLIGAGSFGRRGRKPRRM